MSAVELAADETGSVTVALLEAIGDAFNRHDVDAIINFFAEDGMFDNAMGPEIHGQCYVGKETFRAFFSELMTSCPDVQWNAIDNRVDGNKGFPNGPANAPCPTAKSRIGSVSTSSLFGTA